MPTDSKDVCLLGKTGKSLVHGRNDANDPTRTHEHVRFCPAIGGQADINSASSDRLGLLGIPVHPASLIRLAGATFMVLGVVLMRT